MTTDLQLFEREAQHVIKNFADLDKDIKEATKVRDSYKKNLEELMDKYGVKSLDNEYIKVTYVEPTESVSIDLKRLEKEEIETYESLIEDFPKVTKRKGYARITVK